MNLSDEVLVNLSKHKLKAKDEETFKINYLLDDYTNKVVTVKCRIWDVC